MKDSYHALVGINDWMLEMFDEYYNSLADWAEHDKLFPKNSITVFGKLML